MEEAWERAVEAALEGKATSPSEVRVLNLDSAVKSLHGCLPPAGLLERFPNLEQLSIANVGAPSLERFPRLPNLQRLILSDNRIASGLESLVEAGLQSLRDLDLSNNRIQYIEDLHPLAKLSLVSLDLYECPVTRVGGYRSKVFLMIRTLRYLDKIDANGNERPESDDEEDEEDEEDEYDEDEEDPGSSEIDGADQSGKLTGVSADYGDGDDGIVDADEDDGSDADEEEMEMETGGRGSAHESLRSSSHHLSNGFQAAAPVYDEDDSDDDGDGDDDDDLGEEIDEEEADDEDEAVDMHHILDSDDEDDGVDEAEPDEEEIDEDDNDDDNDELEENNDELEVGYDRAAEPGSTDKLAGTEGVIDGHELGEEDENGEIGEEDEHRVVDGDGVEEVCGEGDDEDDLDGEYLVQSIARQDSVVGNEEDEIDQEDEKCQNLASCSSFASNKRSRDEDHHVDDQKEEMRLRKRQDQDHLVDDKKEEMRMRK